VRTAAVGVAYDAGSILGIIEARIPICFFDMTVRLGTRLRRVPSLTARPFDRAHGGPLDRAHGGPFDATRGGRR
jgi:hypothetical protein